MSEQELKPCPFCGKAPIVTHSHYHCPDRYCAGYHGSPISGAVGWNRRAQEPVAVVLPVEWQNPKTIAQWNWSKAIAEVRRLNDGREFVTVQELERRTKNSERYEFLRDSDQPRGSCYEYTGNGDYDLLQGEKLDAAIDAAMRQSEGKA